jgi:hypothetical protein
MDSRIRADRRGIEAMVRMVRRFLTAAAVLALLVTLQGCNGSGDEEGPGELRKPSGNPKPAPGMSEVERAEEPGTPGEEPPPDKPE